MGARLTTLARLEKGWGLPSDAPQEGDTKERIELMLERSEDLLQFLDSILKEKSSPTKSSKPSKVR